MPGIEPTSHRYYSDSFPRGTKGTPFCGLFDDGHSDRCEVIAHGGFDLHFPDNSFIEHLFMHWLAIWMSSSEKCLFSSFAQFSVELFGFFAVELNEFFIYFGY